ncbi:anti-sigma factor family protein [Chitinophaga sp. GCM10012297]|uniref:Uncharacterized protein n=1 Tax=Chitinophaga chungangae TaxID=2821488 RepID=A0ABS3YDG7_9BACT|nr:hypothetical protein [Chitinophaga chungangae]MBO9152726.1 hypothetical protein [Chitinophaga chungangae]
MSVDIHISNYEEYLYSYVDGELTPDEIMALELFLDQHPNLRTELDLLMATRLHPDEFVFSAKAALYKSSGQEEKNYEEQLLSYMDGELDQQAARELELFMDAHPPLRQELEIWEKTRLVPDLSVRFENKPALYRHTSRTVRMRPAYWWAAAAMLAGALFLLRNTFTQNDTANPTVAATSEPAARPAQQAPAPQQVPAADALQQPDAAVLAQESNTGNTAVEEQATPSPAPRALARATQNNASQAETAVNEPEQAIAEADLSSLRTRTAAVAARPPVSADLSGDIPAVKENGTLVAMNNKPSIDIQTAPLATPPPPPPPGELIMSVTGNGLESKVLDKVTNVAKLFSRKRNNNK